MKRLTSLLLVIALVLSVAHVGYAQTAPKKLGRGIINTLTGIMEVPADVLKTSKAEGVPMGITVGLGRGLVKGICRTLAGLYEIVTFPIPAPAEYAPITDPEILLTSETLKMEEPSMRSDFRPLSSELEGKTVRK